MFKIFWLVVLSSSEHADLLETIDRNRTNYAALKSAEESLSRQLQHVVDGTKYEIEKLETQLKIAVMDAATANINLDMANRQLIPFRGVDLDKMRKDLISLRHFHDSTVGLWACDYSFDPDSKKDQKILKKYNIFRIQ